MSRKLFKSELGDVKIFPDRITRENRKGDWSKIKSEYHEPKLVDSINFINIENVKINIGSYYTVLKIKSDGKWLNMFFKTSDDAEKCFKALKYGLNVYRENH